MTRRQARDPDTVERTLRMVRWGLVPSWAKDVKGGARMINARSETAGEKPAFRRALNARRCLIPADGWYEWQRGKDHKQPYYTHYIDGSSLAMAGLWEYWKPKDDPDGEYPDGLVTATVLTAAAVGPLAQVHDRMPLVLAPSAWDAWLDPDTGADDPAVSGLLVPPPPELVAAMEIRPVGVAVNNVRNNGAELLAPLPPEEVPAPLQLDLLTTPGGPESSDTTSPVDPGTATPQEVAGPRTDPARITVQHAAGPAALLLGHGAGGGVGAPDLTAASRGAGRLGEGGAGRTALPGGRPPRTGPGGPAGRGLAGGGGGGCGPSSPRVRCCSGGAARAPGGLPHRVAGGRGGRAVPGLPGEPPGRPDRDRLAELAELTVPGAGRCRVTGTRSAGRSRPRAGRSRCCAAITRCAPTCRA